ncbi:5838_t:CDS:2, partial [Scutellospora calospora]
MLKDLLTETRDPTPYCSPDQQELVTQKLITFVIKFVQPLYILEEESFKDLMTACVPGYKIPCIKTAKDIIHKAYQSSKNELKSMLKENVLVDTKTRWNSTYYTWKRVLELHNAMRHVSNSLLLSSDRLLQKEGKKLERLCLTLDEKIFLNNIVNMLAPFEKITRRISGSNYATFSMIHPYMEILKNSFVPRSDLGETKQSYLDLIYGSTNFDENSDNSSNYSSDSISSDDNIPSGGTLNTNGLLTNVRAAIFLSLDELWAIPSDLALIASILDPRFKTFQWAPNQLNHAKRLLERSYMELKIALELLNLNNDLDNPVNNSKTHDEDDEFFGQLKIKPRQALEFTEYDEVTRYLILDNIELDDDPIK